MRIPVRDNITESHDLADDLATFASPDKQSPYLPFLFSKLEHVSLITKRYIILACTRSRKWVGLVD